MRLCTRTNNISINWFPADSCTAVVKHKPTGAFPPQFPVKEVVSSQNWEHWRWHTVHRVSQGAAARLEPQPGTDSVRASDE